VFLELFLSFFLVGVSLIVNSLLDSFIPFIIILLLVSISVAFYILLERKFLSYSQNRKGPNKVTFGGLGQSVLDAMKLVVKEQPILSQVRYVPFFIGGVGLVIIMVWCWFYT